jgi:CheY-like chemotaxis protein
VDKLKSMTKSIKSNIPESMYSKILIVDDNDFNLKIMKHHFSRLKIDCDVYISSNEALDYINERL